MIRPFIITHDTRRINFQKYSQLTRGISSEIQFSL